MKRVIALLLVAGCSVFDPTLVEGPALGAAPVRPAAATEGPDGPVITIALRDVTLNQDPVLWREIGLNLDGLVSEGEPRPTECVPPDGTSLPPEDGMNGIDNVFGATVYPIVDFALPDFESNARAGQLAGIGTFVIRVFGWNGTPNDPRVEVVLTQAAGGTSVADPSDLIFDDEHNLVGAGGDPAPAPGWMGDDAFFGRDDNFLMGNESQPLIRDDNAYVSDGTMVMRIPDRVDILFFGSETTGARVRLTDATAIAHFDDAGGFDVATVSGRWSLNDLLDTGENLNVCVGSTERTIIEGQLDRNADLRSTPGTGGEGVSCDAISIGVRFSGVRARWAGLGPSRPLPNPCTAGEE